MIADPAGSAVASNATGTGKPVSRKRTCGRVVARWPFAQLAQVVAAGDRGRRVARVFILHAYMYTAVCRVS